MRPPLSTLVVFATGLFGLHSSSFFVKASETIRVDVQYIKAMVDPSFLSLGIGKKKRKKDSPPF